MVPESGGSLAKEVCLRWKPRPLTSLYEGVGARAALSGNGVGTHSPDLIGCEHARGHGGSSQEGVVGRRCGRHNDSAFSATATSVLRGTAARVLVGLVKLALAERRDSALELVAIFSLAVGGLLARAAEAGLTSSGVTHWSSMERGGTL